MAQHIEDVFEDRARAGDAGASIAYAIMKLASAQDRLAVAVDKCGMNIYQADGAPGALEMIGMTLIDINETLKGAR